MRIHVRPGFYSDEEFHRDFNYIHPNAVLHPTHSLFVYEFSPDVTDQIVLFTEVLQPILRMPAVLAVEVGDAFAFRNSKRKDMLCVMNGSEFSLFNLFDRTAPLYLPLSLPNVWIYPYKALHPYAEAVSVLSQMAMNQSTVMTESAGDFIVYIGTTYADVCRSLIVMEGDATSNLMFSRQVQDLIFCVSVSPEMFLHLKHGSVISLGLQPSQWLVEGARIAVSMYETTYGLPVAGPPLVFYVDRVLSGSLSETYVQLVSANEE